MATWTIPPNFAYALFVAGDRRLGEAPRSILDRVLEALAAGPPPAVQLGRWIVNHGRAGIVPLAEVRAQLPAQALAELGIEAAQTHRFANATHGMLIRAQTAGALDPCAPWGLLVLAATMAGAADGIVYDSGTFRVLPQSVLENPLDGFLFGAIKNHVAIVTSVDSGGRQTTTTTIGLNKYGLFELRLRGSWPPADVDGVLVAALAQAVVDARPPEPGAWTLPATFAVGRSHAARANATEIAPDGRDGTTVCIGLAPPADVADVYWDVTISSDDDGAALEAASRILEIGSRPESALQTALSQATGIARNRLSEAQRAFARRALTQDVVLVKTRFTTPDRRTEYVWSRVEEWGGKRLQAIVASRRPSVATVGIGDRVSVDVDDIVDWRVERPNGEALGNFSAAVHDGR